MSMVPVELQRRKPDNSLVPWYLNSDGTDPVADAAVLAQLDIKLSALGTGIVGAIASTQPRTVTGTVAISNPTTNPETGLAKQVTQTDGSQKTQVTNFPGIQPVSGPLTDTQIRATPVPVSGTVGLDSAALTALENTTVTIDAASLASLESISVQNNVATDMLDRAGRLVGHVTVDNFPATVEIANDVGNAIPVAEVTGLVPKVYNEVVLGYTGTDVTTVTYKQSGATVATLTLTYTSGLITGVVRT